jgi:hypothetical protein
VLYCLNTAYCYRCCLIIIYDLTQDNGSIYSEGNLNTGKNKKTQIQSTLDEYNFSINESMIKNNQESDEDIYYESEIVEYVNIWD